MTLGESLVLNERNGVKHTPELKGGDSVRINQGSGGLPRQRRRHRQSAGAPAEPGGVAAVACAYHDFDPQGRAIRRDSDMYKALDVLARQVRVMGIFSDWPATVTFYANCTGLN
jgi:hypothetical protein